MSRVTTFLSKLDDYELAYFARYKLLTYMKDTQLEIKQFLAEKNITESKIDRLIADNPKAKLTDE